MRKITKWIPFKKWVPLKWKNKILWTYHRFTTPLPDNCKLPATKGVSSGAHKPELIVSLTSYPARIKTVHQTILTLLNQTEMPDRIILWLAREQFPKGESGLPQKLVALKQYGLDIEWTQDLRSYKKLIPCLKKFPEAIIVTCDDDTFYPEHWLKQLHDSYKRFPQYVHCHRGHTIAFDDAGVVRPFLKWQYESTNALPSYLNFQTGVGGVLYPPHALSEGVLDADSFRELAPTCDDHWFWAMAVLNGVKIKIVDNGYRVCQVNLHASTKFSLCVVNTGDDGKSNDDIVFQRICRRFPLLMERLKEEAASGKSAEVASDAN